MVKKLRSKVKNRILPFFLCFIFVFGIAVSSDVFAPKNARAIVGEEFIIPAFYGWLNASNVFINTYNDDTADTQYLANSVAGSLINVANTIQWLDAQITWTEQTLMLELASRLSLIMNDLDEYFFQLDYETSTLFDSATRQFIIDNSLSSDTTNPVTIYSDEAIMLSSGLVLNLVPHGTTMPGSTANKPYTLFSCNVEYELSTGDTFELKQNLDNNTYYWYANGVQKYQNTTANVSPYLWFYLGEPYLNGSTKQVAFRRYNSSGTGFSSYGYVNSYVGMYDLLTNAKGQYTVEATTGTIVQNPELPDTENEDEYGYVGIPAGVGAGTASTGLELLQSMLDYERDKPYSQTSEYTYTISNEVPIQPEPEQPGMVELPLIGIKLPINFSLNLRGIWYYVVQWVNSITGFVGWMFGVFGNLPYAMVVPVYASAVIVIVLGIYKRFFM